MVNKITSYRAKRLIKLLASITGGGALFFLFYAGLDKDLLHKPKYNSSTQKVLDRAVNSSGVKETKSIKKKNDEIIFEDHK